MSSADDKSIERVVLETLEKELAVPAGRLRLDADLTRDLKIDSDDLSFLFVPKLERRLGVKIPVEEWSSVGTVRDAVNLLRRYKNESAQGRDAP